MNNEGEGHLKNSENASNTKSTVLKGVIIKINEDVRVDIEQKDVSQDRAQIKEQTDGDKTNNTDENKEDTTALTGDESVENNTAEDVTINVDDKGESPADDPESYNQQQYGYGYAAGTPYYQQQVVGGRPVYVAGMPPPAPINVATMPAYRQPPPPDDYEYYRSERFGSTFDSQQTRHRFVQRVYTILTVQLLYTTFFIALCVFVPSVKYFVLTNFLLYMLATIAMLCLVIALICCINLRRTYPTNFILLALFTISFSYILGVVSATYSTKVVMMSFGITAGVCFIISIFACQTSIDVTGCGAYLCIASFVVLLFGLIAMIVGMITKMPILMVVYAGLLAFLFSMYLMYDTQQIMGGRRMELSEEEYIAGALCLYVDIMYIFWTILTICGFANN